MATTEEEERKGKAEEMAKDFPKLLSVIKPHIQEA